MYYEKVKVKQNKEYEESLQQIKNIIDEVLKGTLFTIHNLYWSNFKGGYFLEISKIHLKCYNSTVFKPGTTIKDIQDWLQKTINENK